MSQEQLDDDDDDQDDDQDQADEQRALARSGELQLALLCVLNDPAQRWDHTPAIAAHGIAAVLQRALAHIVRHDPKRRSWALDLLDGVRDQVADTTAVIDGEPGGTLH